MKRFFIMSMLVLFSPLLLTGCQNIGHLYEEESTEISRTLETPYVGNISAVSMIIQELSIPQDGWQQRFMSIGDDFGSGLAPYTLTVYYELHNLSENIATHIQELPIHIFEENAAFLFAHIGNLEEVTFALRQTPSNDILDSAAYEYFWTIARHILLN